MRDYICPLPARWYEIYQELLCFCEKNCNLDITSPPKPLILAAWNFTSNLEKNIRWKETENWINRYYTNKSINIINDEDRYYG